MNTVTRGEGKKYFIAAIIFSVVFAVVATVISSRVYESANGLKGFPAGYFDQSVTILNCEFCASPQVSKNPASIDYTKTVEDFVFWSVLAFVPIFLIIKFSQKSQT